MTAGGTLPLVAVLTPTRDRHDLLERAIDTVRRQRYAGPIVHVIVDNGDRDALDLIPADTANRSTVYVRDHGLAGAPIPALFQACHNALDTRDVDVVTCLSDDDELTVDAVRVAVDALGTHRRWLIGGTVIVDVARNPLHYRGGDQASLDRTLAGDYQLGGAVYWRPDLFDQVQGWDESYDGAPDFDLYTRFAAVAAPAFVTDVLYVALDWHETDSRRRAHVQQASGQRVRERLATGPHVFACDPCECGGAPDCPRCRL